MQMVYPNPNAMPKCSLIIQYTHSLFPPSLPSLSHTLIAPPQSPFLIINKPPPIEHGDAVLHGVDGVADDGEDDEENDYYDGDHKVALDHFSEIGRSWGRVKGLV